MKSVQCSQRYTQSAIRCVRQNDELKTIIEGMDVLVDKSGEEHESVRKTSQSVDGIIVNIDALSKAVESQSG